MPAGEVEEPRREVLGVVQRPAAGAGAAQREDGVVAVTVPDGLQPVRHQAEGLGPAHLAEPPGAPRAGTHERSGQTVRRLLLPPGLEPAHAPLEERAAGRVVPDAGDPASGDGGEQRAAAAAVAVAGDGQGLVDVRSSRVGISS